jgi:hypothetical protein
MDAKSLLDGLRNLATDAEASKDPDNSEGLRRAKTIIDLYLAMRPSTEDKMALWKPLTRTLGDYLSARAFKSSEIFNMAIDRLDFLSLALQLQPSAPDVARLRSSRAAD